MTRSAGAARWLLVPILLAYGYLAVGYARVTPRWNNPDEPAHVNVIRQIATTGALPILRQGDWDKPLLDRLASTWFPNDYEVDGIRYEGHQPPLYYLLAAPIHRLTLSMPLNRQILALRLFSVAIGAIVVIAAFVVAREAAPDRPALAPLTAATVAFVPMHTAIAAAVNNDALANALAAVTLAALMIGRRCGFSDRWAVGLGVLIGLLVLTKLTVYVYIPLILLTLLLAGRSPSSATGTADAAKPLASSSLAHGGATSARSAALPRGSFSVAQVLSDVVPQNASRAPQEPARRRRVAPRSGWGAGALRWPLITSAVGLLVSGWWLVRNMLVYGPLDPLAMVRHDQIVVGQPRWPAYDLEALDVFARILFRSFWGMFGWMALVLDDGFYILYLVLMVLGVAGALIGWRARKSPHPPDPSLAQERGENVQAGSPLHRSDAGIRRSQGARPFVTEGPGVGPRLRHQDLLGWAVLLVFAEVAYYNLTFIQPQGRYLFPALVPTALFLAHGWWHLAARATARPIVRLLTAGLLAGAVAWTLAEGYGALRAAEVRATPFWLERLWSDQALIATAGVAALAVLLAPARIRRRLPAALCLLLGFGLGVLDLAALVTFVGPAFPLR